MDVRMDGRIPEWLVGFLGREETQVWMGTGESLRQVWNESMVLKTMNEFPRAVGNQSETLEH